MTDKPRKTEPPLKLDMGFHEALARLVKTDPKEISSNPSKISVLAPKHGPKEISCDQGELDLQVEKDFDGIGMGVLSDGTPYLNQRGLAALCGVQNAHIGTISTQWAEEDQKPRVVAIKAILTKGRRDRFPSPL